MGDDFSDVVRLGKADVRSRISMPHGDGVLEFRDVVYTLDVGDERWSARVYEYGNPSIWESAAVCGGSLSDYAQRTCKN